MAKIKATIVNGTGSKVKQFRFVLWGANGRVIAFGEHYTRRHNCKKTLAKYFPQYPVFDLTK